MDKFKLVPVEPTGEMIAAAQNAFPCSQVEAYQAMLTAAPDVQGEPVALPTDAQLVEIADNLGALPELCCVADHPDLTWHIRSFVRDMVREVLRLYTAPQPVILPPPPYMSGVDPDQLTEYEQGEAQGRCDMWSMIQARVNGQPDVQQGPVDYQIRELVSDDDKHWSRRLHGGTVESHTEFLLSGHKRVFNQHPSKRALQNHIRRLSRMVDEVQAQQEPPAGHPMPPAGYVLIAEDALRGLIGDEQFKQIVGMCRVPLHNHIKRPSRMVSAAPAAQGEPVGWLVTATGGATGDKPYRVLKHTETEAERQADHLKSVGCSVEVEPLGRYAAPQTAEQKPDEDIARLPDEVKVLLNHIEDVVPDEVWEKISTEKWNAVTRLAAPQPVEQQYTPHPDEDYTPEERGRPELEPVRWFNGCDKTVPEALRYLANHDRPAGGESRFNWAHLLQLADEIGVMSSSPLYTAPQPGPIEPERIEAAAKKLAQLFHYPWEYMPEQGRNEMRENVEAIIRAIREGDGT